MNTNTERFEALVKLGIHLKKFTAQDSDFAELQNSIEKAKQANGWFTQASIESVLKSWGERIRKKCATKLVTYLHSSCRKSQKRLRSSSQETFPW
jgi:hypothetical protein